jgi:hypothetical protein
MLIEGGEERINEYFKKNCRNKETCSIDMDILSLIKQECKDRMNTLASD